MSVGSFTILVDESSPYFDAAVKLSRLSTCYICHGPPKDPVVGCCELHGFCADHICDIMQKYFQKVAIQQEEYSDWEDWEEVKVDNEMVYKVPKCLFCKNNDMDFTKISESDEYRDVIEYTESQCNKCNEKMPTSAIFEHIAKKIQCHECFALVPFCSGLDEHFKSKECEKAVEHCKHCDKWMPFRSIADHLDTCESRKRRRKCCGEQVSQKEMVDHRLVCDGVKIKCEVCGISATRRDIKSGEHIESDPIIKKCHAIWDDKESTIKALRTIKDKNLATIQSLRDEIQKLLDDHKREIKTKSVRANASITSLKNMLEQAYRDSNQDAYLEEKRKCEELYQSLKVEIEEKNKYKRLYDSVSSIMADLSQCTKTPVPAASSSSSSSSSSFSSRNYSDRGSSASALASNSFSSFSSGKPSQKANVPSKAPADAWASFHETKEYFEDEKEDEEDEEDIHVQPQTKRSKLTKTTSARRDIAENASPFQESPRRKRSLRSKGTSSSASSADAISMRIAVPDHVFPGKSLCGMSYGVIDLSLIPDGNGSIPMVSSPVRHSLFDHSATSSSKSSIYSHASPAPNIAPVDGGSRPTSPTSPYHQAASSCNRGISKAHRTSLDYGPASDVYGRNYPEENEGDDMADA